ncbi:MAG TPA: MMPL family transporter [Ktedonobacterales bacterium]|nr:MMPL family transporter [Ktedonobacterales bacterium]
MLIQESPDVGAPQVTAPAPGAEKSLERHGLYRFGLAYGRFIYRVRWIVVALWIAVVIASVPFAARVGTVLTGGGFSFPNSDSVRVNDILTTTLHQPATQMLVVFQSPSTPVSDPAYQQELADFTAKAVSFPGVIDVRPAQTGQDGQTALVVLSFNVSADKVEHEQADIRAMVPTGPNIPARAYLTGNPAISNAFSQISQQDTERAEFTALPLALFVLLLTFGTLVAAMMPLILALIAVPVALALLYAIALHTQTNTFVTNIVSIIGLGISIDYSLFMVRRFRDELHMGRSIQEAVGWTVATAGEAILFSGMTVMIGFVGLLLIGIGMMTSFGIGGAIVVACSMLAALTMLPALLSILGPRIDALRLPLVGRLVMRSREKHESRGFWRAWALGVMRRPVLVIIAVIVLLIGLSWPIFSLNIGTPGVGELPATVESRQGLNILASQFPGAGVSPIEIVVQSPVGSSMLAPTNLSRLDTLSQWVASQPHVTSVTGLTMLPATSGAPALSASELEQMYATGAYLQSPQLARLVQSTTNGNTTVVMASSDAPPDSAAAKAQIDALRAGVGGVSGGLTVLVGGSQAISQDFTRYLFDNFPRAILFVLIATFFLLLLMFRSVLLPLQAVLTNVLSVSAAYGVLVYVFQWGHFSGFLGFTSTGYIDSIIPILLFCILFGLSMDYEVFLLSRIREEWLRTGNNRQAVAQGLAKTGGVITNAALLFVIVTGAFTFTRVITTKEIGLGMTAAVLVDATIIRSLLVPATMRLLGRWNWWLPGRPVPQERGG